VPITAITTALPIGLSPMNRTRRSRTYILPDAEVKIDSEADPDILAEYQVNDGEMFVLPEGA
jgi:hypothetical protein